MAKKKNNGDKSLDMSREYFESLTKVTLLNVNHFNSYDSLFIVADTSVHKQLVHLGFNVIRAFFINRQRNKGKYQFNWYWDNLVHKTFMNITNAESDEEFINTKEATRKIIYDELKNGRLYAKNIT